MIYKGTNYTERINFATCEGQKFWTELRKAPTTPKLEVFLCEDMGTSRNVWSWWFDITDPMTYEQIKLNVMEMMFEADTVQELADTMEDTFTDGFEAVLLDTHSTD